ncbi:hypothetical protein [Coleofasciculus sp. H7-2]|uniref:hypothetical protein n=1 Tax=Coleofasciculus sp. H7-2 TaxID=3351545 RepID=UPI00366EFFD4
MNLSSRTFGERSDVRRALSRAVEPLTLGKLENGARCTSRITRLGFKPQAYRIKSSEED